MDYEKNAKASAKAFNKWHKQNRYIDRENARRAWSAGVDYGIKSQPLSEIPQSFNDWWNAENLTQNNPFQRGTAAFWAWEGWQASLAAIAAESAQSAPVGDGDERAKALEEVVKLIDKSCISPDAAHQLRMAIYAMKKG